MNQHDDMLVPGTVPDNYYQSIMTVSNTNNILRKTINKITSLSAEQINSIDYRPISQCTYIVDNTRRKPIVFDPFKTSNYIEFFIFTN